MEEEYGLAKRAMLIYERSTQTVADEDKFEVSPVMTSSQRVLPTHFCRCSQFILPKQRRRLVYPLLEPSTSVPSRYSLTDKLLRCAYASLLLNANWAKLTELEQSTLMLPNFAIQGLIRISGPSGMRSKSRPGARIRLGRCCESSEVYKPNSTRKQATLP